MGHPLPQVRHEAPEDLVVLGVGRGFEGAQEIRKGPNGRADDPGRVDPGGQGSLAGEHRLRPEEEPNRPGDGFVLARYSHGVRAFGQGFVPVRRSPGERVEGVDHGAHRRLRAPAVGISLRLLHGGGEANRPAVVVVLENWLATFPDRDSAIAKLHQHQVPAAPVLSIEETLTHPHLTARGTVRTIDDPLAGRFEIPGMPLKFSAFPVDLPLQAPTLGQHNSEILRDWLGHSEAEIAALCAANVLCEGDY